MSAEEQLHEEGAADQTQNGASAPPGDVPEFMSLPAHGCEVFMGGLPRTATDDQLREFAEAAGEVHSVHLLKDPNNATQNKGHALFGFVRYKERASAVSAQEKLHQTSLKDFATNKVRVAPSQTKHKLYIGNIPKAWTKDQYLAELNALVHGVEAIDLLMSKENPSENRGFSFVAFYNNEAAAAAKDALTRSDVKFGGRTLNVSLAEPRAQEQGAPAATAAAQIKAIYVGNLPEGATEEKLKELFSSHGEVSKVTIPAPKEGRPRQQFGFVHFSERAPVVKLLDDAVRGVKPELDGNAIEVKQAKPQTEMRQQGSFDAPGGGFGGPGFGGRGGFPPGGRGPGRGRGRGPPRGGFGGGFGGGGGYNGGGYNAGGYEGYEQPYGGYDAGYDAYGGGGGGYGGDYGGYGGGAVAPAGMTMVPMMLPSGQVGYVLQSADGGGGDFGGGGGGAVRSPGYGGGRGGGRRGGRGRGGGQQRYTPY